MTPTKSKNFKLATSFYDYCCAHPELRFWQCLYGWIGKGKYILIADTSDFGTKKQKYNGIRDTFYFENKID